jgi:FXSXX-COOH protein
MTDNAPEPAEQPAPSPEPEERRSLIVDVTAIPITDLDASDDTVLANSIRRLLADLERSTESISGWSSYVE